MLRLHPFAKLQAVLLFTRSVCSRPPASSVVLRFDLPLRHLLSQYEKTKTLALTPSETPLKELRGLLRSSLKPSYAGLDVQLEIRHGKRSIETDAEFADIVARTASKGCSPTLRIVPKDLAALPTPPAPAADAIPPLPSDIGPLRLVSFFKFTTLDTTLRAALMEELTPLLASLYVRGTVYVAAEGVNGQMSVPLKSLDALREAMGSLPGLGGLQLNVQHETLGTVETHETAAPYRKLVVREKHQILTDGLQAAQVEENIHDHSQTPALDWERAGTELDPSDWHAMLEQRAGSKDADTTATLKAGTGSAPLLLDCRNDYESAAGTFEGAEPLNTRIFSESWDVLRERLTDVPRDQPIMTFCTGGIRCVKTNAFLEQELGFSNTYRLRDGIHGYLRHARDALPQDASKWRGENFVFYETENDAAGQADDE